MSVLVRDFDPDALRLMQGYAWPGNVRELRNTIERVLVLHGRDERVATGHLPEAMRSAPPAAEPVPKTGPASLSEAVAAFERELVVEALRQTNGVQTRAAQRLGTTRRILNYRMRKLEIPASGTL
jgi:transcriptional regulator with GAF, ATPase, and Fis domain